MCVNLVDYSKYPWLSALFALTLLFSFPLHSQELNSCTTIAYDPDGDGFGWDPFEQSSCVVDDQTAPAPTVTNLETGEVITLLRNYWDGNVDFANREIQCDFFEFRETTQQYTLDRSYRYWHLPLPDQPPWVSGYYVYFAEGEIRNTLPLEHDGFFNTGPWSIAHGLRVLSFADIIPGSWWVDRQFPLRTWSERVVYPDGKQALRNWSGSLHSASEYQDCFYTSGEVLQATGHWDQTPTSSGDALTESPLFFTGEIEPQPEIVHLATGQPVQFETGVWDMQADFTNKEIRCDDMTWNPTSGEFQFRPIGGPVFEYVFLPRLAQYPDTGIYLITFDFAGSGRQWKIENNIIDMNFPPSQWFEAIVNEEGTEGVRYWLEEDRFIDCYAWDHGSSLKRSLRQPVSFRPSLDQLPDDTGDITGVTEVTDANQSNTNPQLIQQDNSNQTIESAPLETASASGGGAFSGFMIFILLVVSGIRPVVKQ